MESGRWGSRLSSAPTAALSRVAVSVSGALKAGCATTPPHRAEARHDADARGKQTAVRTAAQERELSGRRGLRAGETEARTYLPVPHAPSFSWCLPLLQLKGSRRRGPHSRRHSRRTVGGWTEWRDPQGPEQAASGPGWYEGPGTLPRACLRTEVWHAGGGHPTAGHTLFPLLGRRGVSACLLGERRQNLVARRQKVGAQPPAPTQSLSPGPAEGTLGPN